MQDRDEATKKKRKEDIAELQRQLDEGADCGWKDEVRSRASIL